MNATQTPAASVTIETLASQTAKALTALTGTTWTAKHNPHNDTVILAGDGVELFVSIGWRDARLYFKGRFPEYTLPSGAKEKVLPYNATIPEISVATTRPADAIAKEIKRRLIGPVKLLLVECEKTIGERDAYYKAKGNITKQVVTALGEAGRVSNPNNDEGDIHVERGGIWGTMKPGRDDVRIDLHNVPPELAIVLAKAIHDYQPAK